MNHSAFQGFYKRTTAQRQQIIAEQLGLTADLAADLPTAIGEHMVENYLYNYALPLGVGVNLTVNGKPYCVPMAVEEPSVIAAASNGAKLAGNVIATTQERELIGQVVLLTDLTEEALAAIITEHEPALLTLAKEHSASMVARGGGPRRIWAGRFDNGKQAFASVYVAFDPCHAMGANALNTVLEAIAPQIAELTASEVLMRILSNHQPDKTTKASVALPIERLHRDSVLAEQTAQRIALASDYAQLDIYRATTHNKGIMNGLDALVMATGNDWRAVEAGVHSFAARSGHYQPLSRWWVDEGSQQLIGEIELPLAVATVGGTLSNHPTAQRSLEILGIDSPEQLANVLASLGLVQNLAALRALVSEGIQRGHMRMQARALALQVGATGEEVSQLVEALAQAQQINRITALELLDKLRTTKGVE